MGDASQLFGTMSSMETETTEEIKQEFTEFEQFIQQDWLLTALAAIVILVVTAVITHFATKLVRKIVQKDKTDLLPSSSILVNVVRGICWFAGICAVLAFCFDVDITAAIAALGVGGIALSLGLQDTISNLIGGLQVSFLKIIEPGDNIQVGSSRGVVRDITWHHTTIVTITGEEVTIPNSVINKEMLIHLAPVGEAVVPFVICTNGKDLSVLSSTIEAACTTALEAHFTVTKQPKIRFTEVGDFGFRGKIIFSIADKELVNPAIDTAVKAIAPFTRGSED